MKTSFFKSGIAALTLASMLSPAAAFALTPTQWFNQLVRTPSTTTAAEAADATLSVAVTERFNDKKRKNNTGKVDLSFSVRALPKQGAVQTSEGAFSLNTLVMSDSTLGLPFSVTEPIAFDWKQTEDTIYVRVTNIPDSLMSYLEESSAVDFSGLMNKWIAMPFDQKELLQESGFTDAQNTNDILNKGPLAKTQLINRVSVEKKWKNDKGEEILRLKGRVNTAIAYTLYLEQVKQAKKDYPIGAARTERLKTLYKDYIKMRTALSSVYLAANINTAQKRIERLEFSAKITEPKEDCIWNSSFTKQTCKTIGTAEVVLKGGINIKKDAGLPIVAPAEFMTLSDVEDYFDAQRPAPLYYDDEYYNETYGDTSYETYAPNYAPVSAVTQADHVRGYQGAPITLIQYSDFQCPFCQRFVPSLEKALVDYPLDIRVVYRHFPLSSIHPEAKKAAEASECAAKLSGEEAFWGMHNLLFANQYNLSHAYYLEAATELGINESAFASCLDSGEMAARVNKDLEEGMLSGVEGTPATFVNGVMISGAVPYEQLKAAIEVAKAK